MLLLVLAILASLVWILYAASELDDQQRPTKSTAVGHKDLFVVEVREEDRPVIVIECDEGVNGDANARFREYLGVSGPPISIPGGPLLLAKAASELSDEHGGIARSAIELLKRYSPERVILISHSECLLYDVGGAYLGQPEMVPLAQRLDLIKAANFIKDWLPKSKVEVYYAYKDGRFVKFNPVLLNGEETR
jgi:hypothetical protein